MGDKRYTRVRDKEIYVYCVIIDKRYFKVIKVPCCDTISSDYNLLHFVKLGREADILSLSLNPLIASCSEF